MGGFCLTFSSCSWIVRSFSGNCAAPLLSSYHSNRYYIASGYKISSKNDKRYGLSIASTSFSSSASVKNINFRHVNEEIKIQFTNGIPVMILPLPSRQEKCLFVIRPISDTVGFLCEKIINEDSGVQLIGFYTSDGIRISKSISAQYLIKLVRFRLRINDDLYNCSLDVDEQNWKSFQSLDKDTDINDLCAKVASLHAILNVDDLNNRRKEMILKHLEKIDSELKPLMIIRRKIEEECEIFSRRLIWLGFSALCIQMGFFMRLVWWDFSWDVIEPITYFTTHSAILLVFGYYLTTRQNFEYTALQDRTFNKCFHRRAQRYNFNVERYNELCTSKNEISSNLKQMEGSFLQQLPTRNLIPESYTTLTHQSRNK